MRVRRGNFEYEVKHVKGGWEHSVYRIRPPEAVIQSWCCSATRDGAEREAQQIIMLLEAQERLNLKGRVA
jgi:hypothetical protein